MSVKKQKLVDLSPEEKQRVKKTSLLTLTGTALVCLILVGCFACSQDTNLKNPEMTDEQRALYWQILIVPETWYPMTDSTNDGIVKDMTKPRNIKTTYDESTNKYFVYCLIDTTRNLKSAELVLTSNTGTLVFNTEEPAWSVKFSESNDTLYMTITDSAGKVVYYSNKEPTS